MARRGLVVRLVPVLTGKACGAYVAMAAVDTRIHILAKYEIDAQVYRLRFRDTDIKPRNTPRELCM